jgi:type VI secretion system protein VasJ
MALLEDLLSPISAGSFCGEDGSYDPDFEAARNEADKSTENNYALMEEASKRFLIKKSKDMRALGYLALAAAMNDSLDSFGETVTAYCRLVMEHWDDIHPKRPTARANALKWLNGERNVGLLAALEGGATYETLQAACDKLEELRGFCDQKFTENPPSFGSFAKLVKEMAEKRKPKPVEETPAPDAGGSAGTAAGSAPGPIASADDALLSIQNGAYWLQENAKTDPLPYRLIRLLKWGPLQEAVPNNGGKTMIPAPYATAVEAYRNLFDSQQWADLAKNGEEAFSGDGMLFWFDLQRYICAGLLGMGPEYAACAKAIRTELALLLSRLPALSSLAFDDGTPFADGMTQDWLQADVLSLLGGGGGGGGMAPIKKKGDVGEEQKQASLLMAEGKLEAALHVLRTGLSNDSSVKNNFDRKLIMADLLFKGNKPHVARSLLEDLKASIAAYSLERWDPDLCVSVFLLTQKVYLALMASADEALKPGFWEKAVEAHTQISKLDPVLAISADLK